ncbi:hypothetical protein EO213_08350 [Paracoccus denitrificans]|nr:hypothetical protein EO213_08350 [Paracoccus denitrificans]
MTRTILILGTNAGQADLIRHIGWQYESTGSRNATTYRPTDFRTANPPPLGRLDFRQGIKND